MNLTLLLIHWENSQYFRLCLVECKIFSKYKIFSGENIFGKGKYFLVFDFVLENSLKNPFLSCFSHFLKIQTNIITENQDI